MYRYFRKPAKNNTTIFEKIKYKVNTDLNLPNIALVTYLNRNINNYKVVKWLLKKIDISMKRRIKFFQISKIKIFNLINNYFGMDICSYDILNMKFKITKYIIKKGDIDVEYFFDYENILPDDVIIFIFKFYKLKLSDLSFFKFSPSNIKLLKFFHSQIIKN